MSGTAKAQFVRLRDRRGR